MVRPFGRQQVEAPFRVQRCRILQSPDHHVSGPWLLAFPWPPGTLQGSCWGRSSLAGDLGGGGCHVAALPELGPASPHLLRPRGETFMGHQLNGPLLFCLHLPCPSPLWPGSTTTCSGNTYGFEIVTPVLTEPCVSGRALERPRPVLGRS